MAAASETRHLAGPRARTARGCRGIHHPSACRLGLGLVRRSGSGSGTRSRVCRVVTGLLGEGPVPPVGGDGLPSLYFYPPIGVCHAGGLDDGALGFLCFGWAMEEVAVAAARETAYFFGGMAAG